MRARHLSVFTVAAVAAGAHANLIVNGSFEDGTFVADANGAMSLAAGSTSLTGWEIVDLPIAWIDNANTFNSTAPDGNRALDLTGYGDSQPYGGVRQTVTTVIGQEYILGFDLGVQPSFGPIARLGVDFGGDVGDFSLNATGSEEEVWQRFFLQFTATSTSTVITLHGIGPSGNHIGLDNVTLDVVPEPATLSALGLGFLVAARMRRRRTQA